MKIQLDSFSTFFYIALSLMLSRDELSVVPEIMYILEPEQVLQFLDMFGGQTIRVPTRDEFAKDLQAALTAYYIQCEGKTDREIQDILGVDGHRMNSIKKRIDKYIEFVNREGLVPPELLRGVIDVRQNYS